ncbi:hypothetical protein Tsubulata_001529 [Turnera subulata]|uniref:J domain-containing protein n=1 Tax=Turnera subulata TaxID=218843 RepID=A0A9Q0J3U7_9ROSI|nr:hypothetical protein Tsubulata_001529 [Turnera subulata]
MAGGYAFYYLDSNPRVARRFSTGTSTDSIRAESSGANAYDVLGVSETSSFAEIKASFRKLAKETHPDLARSNHDSASSQRFIQILAAYEILSDSERRAHYDRYLLSQRMVAQQKHSRDYSTLYTYNYRSQMSIGGKEMEVVEWLRWYRSAIQDILLEKRVANGTGYFDELEADFYSAIRAAYYGPLIESMELLPDRFEAEERSVNGTPEVLHLVSGRDLFGMVCLANKVPELSSSSRKELDSFPPVGLGISEYVEEANIANSNSEGDGGVASGMRSRKSECDSSDAFEDLELHVSGRVVAVASRVPPKSQCGGEQSEDAQDQIRVFLISDGYPMSAGKDYSRNSSLGGALRGRIPLGAIMGLRTSPDEGSCFVYDSFGTKTHVIMKHRTFMVCDYPFLFLISFLTFWLFEPRSGLHDIGGWYVETFGRDKKGRTVPSQRYWDGLDGTEQHDK